MANTFTTVCNLCKAPESIKFGERECVKLRLADNTPGKQSVTLFFDAIVSGPDADAAMRLESGDQVVVSGQLSQTEYKAKKDGKGIKKGQKMISFQMPFAKLVQITKSEKFFSGGKDDDSSDEPDASEPNLDAPADGGDSGTAEDPLADVY